MPAPRAGFALIEVAIALALVAAGVTSVALLFPAGIRAQQLARFRLLASVKAIDLVESFNTASTSNPTMDIEAAAPWDSPAQYRALAPDFECRLASHRFGISPLPLAIARRLDADDDEIADHLAAGGYVYYSQPQATTSWEEGSIPQQPPSDLRKLVFAVLGDAQSNALTSVAAQAWPYYAPYPSPPVAVHHAQAFLPGDPWPDPYVSLPGDGGELGRCLLWERTLDPDVGMVFAATDAAGKACGYQPYARLGLAALEADVDGDGQPDGEAAAVRYVQAALGYCQRSGLPASYLTLSSGLVDFIPACDRCRQVRALRYLAHAAMCLTRYHGADDTVAIPAAVIDGTPTPAVAVARAQIVAWHESCVHLGCRFAASFPYDWGVPRPAERPQLMDWPLLEPDLFSPPLGGTIAGTAAGAGGGVAARAWRVIPGDQIRNANGSMSYPGAPWDPAQAGATAHFTLAAPFAAGERCRELVFWAVDWQSFEDFETAPSAPVDASKFPRMAPARADQSFADMLRADDPAAPLPVGLPWLDMHLYTYRNPEKVVLFTSDLSDRPTGADVRGDTVLNQTDYNQAPDRPAAVFCGIYGADRDFDHRLGRGPLPRTARLRATAVARFAVYDPRLTFTLR